MDIIEQSLSKTSCISTALIEGVEKLKGRTRKVEATVASIESKFSDRHEHTLDLLPKQL